MTASQQRDRALAEGLSYDDFLARWRAHVATPLAGLSADARRYIFYAKLNLVRSEAVHAAYTPSERLREAVAALPEPLTLLVITEDWCGDSAFALPVIVEAVKDAPNATLRILPRDAHLDVMDAHLTRGSRSIPKLVAFGPEGEVRFVWGPRTAAGTAHRDALVASGLDTKDVPAQMTAWYEAGGWQHADAELADAFEAVAQAA